MLRGIVVSFAFFSIFHVKVGGFVCIHALSNFNLLSFYFMMDPDLHHGHFKITKSHYDVHDPGYKKRALRFSCLTKSSNSLNVERCLIYFMVLDLTPTNLIFRRKYIPLFIYSIMWTILKCSRGILSMANIGDPDLSCMFSWVLFLSFYNVGLWLVIQPMHNLKW